MYILSVDFNVPAGAVHLMVILQVISGGLGTPEITVRPDVYTGTKPVQITGLTGGSELFVYCIRTDAPYAGAVKVSESAGFKVTVA